MKKKKKFVKKVYQTQMMHIKKTGITLCGIELCLGETYYLKWWNKKLIPVKLIQVTQYGYNLLYEEENRCVLKRHLYVPSNMREKYSGDKKYFMLYEQLYNSFRRTNEE